MKRIRSLLLETAACGLVLLPCLAPAQGTMFTYQGQLIAGGLPASGNFDLTFALYSAANGTGQVGGTLTNLGVGVTNGLFAVTLDFGAQFAGNSRWLQIGVRTNGSAGGFTPLNPLQPLTPAPYAIFAAASSNLNGILPLSQLGSGTAAISITGNSSGATNFIGALGGDVTGSQSATVVAKVGGVTAASIASGANAANSLLNTHGVGNFFTGPSAGNTTMSGGDNTAAGVGAMNLNGAGNGNAAVGYDALFLNTGGSNNVGVGANALLNNTVGSGNIAIGSQAGYSNAASAVNNIDIGSAGASGDSGVIRLGTPGMQSTAILAGIITGNGGGLTNLNAGQLTGGPIALAELPGVVVTNGAAGVTLSNATLTGAMTLSSNVYSGGYPYLYYDGQDNFFAGPFAGNPTSGNGNTALGNSALYNLATASSNTAVGSGALYGDTVGVANTAVGNGALGNNQSGNNNTAMGFQALNASTNGSGNTAEGYRALLSSVSGSNNNAQGVGALLSNVTGSDNTAEGYQALRNVPNGNSNIALGYQAGNAFNGSESGNIDIGNNGVVGDNDTIRIGNAQSTTYIAGVLNGNGAGLTNLNVPALPAGLAFVTSNQLFSGANVFAGGFTVDTGAGVVQLINDGGVVPGLEASGGLASGHMRFRNGLEVWPNLSATNAGYLDVRNTNGSPTITLTGGTGAISCSNVTATTLNGDGSGLTNLNGSQISSGTVSLSRLPSTLITSGETGVALNSAVLNGDSGQNFFAGTLAGFVNAGVDNTGLGDWALRNNTTGGLNTAIGTDCLYNNTTGSDNTAVGANALGSDNTGSLNTAVGESALFETTTGSNNVGTGFDALYGNTSGSFNVASGFSALENNTSGEFNTAIGSYSLFYNQTATLNTALGYEALYEGGQNGFNTAVGASALNQSYDGVENTAVGYAALVGCQGGGNLGLGVAAGAMLVSGSYNIDIANQGATNDTYTIRIGDVQTNTYIAGIIGATIGFGVDVMVGFDGQLGTMTSSARFKRDIHPMTTESDVLLNLQPVTFKYKSEIDSHNTPQFGLIAEEVDKVDPDLVTRDTNGLVYTVRYQAVNAMLLNEFLKQHKTIEVQQKEIESLKAKAERLESLEKRLNDLESRLEPLCAKR